MSEWIRVTDLTTLRRRKKQVVTLGDQDIVLFYVKGNVHAMNDLCVHKQRRLSKGLIFQGKIICPGHQWAFDLETGWVEEWAMCQPVHKVRLEGEEVYVDPEPTILKQPKA